MSSATAMASAAIPGPTPGTRLTEAYARMVARQAYFWAWPMANIYSRRLAFRELKEPGLMGGIVPVAPPNRLCMLTDYIEPAERMVACPNQDVVYGATSLALDESPVVIQVPDFGDRFWVYQVVDLRTDSFADLGKMYGTKPGQYLLVGPNWNGTVPAGIAGVLRSKTQTGMVVPRVYQDDTAEDKRAVQTVLQGIDLYPLGEYTGRARPREWAKLPRFPSQAGAQGEEETTWVVPAKFFDELPLVLQDGPPLPGEEARYAEVLALIDATRKDSALRAAMIDEATRAETDLIAPLLQFRNYGLPLPDHWTTVNNGAAFGTDYFTRTAVAKSNILVNKANETKYFYQDLDRSGARLHGDKHYAVTFAKGQLPPVKGFWSLTLYNKQHFFSPNAIKRYSVGTKNKDLAVNPDGSLTVYVQADPPTPGNQSNWLPAPKDEFSLYIRAYWPEAAVKDGSWTPPPVTPVA